MESFMYESDLERIICESDNYELTERGLYVQEKSKFRNQVYIGNYGKADIVEVCKMPTQYAGNYIDITIYELKKDKIGISAFLQAIRYAKGIERYLWNVRRFERFKLHIRLIGSEIDTSGSFCYIADMFSYVSAHTFDYYQGIECIEFFTYKYDIDGIHFCQMGDTHLIDEGF